MGRLGSIFLLGLTACVSAAPRTVPRVVDGAVERGSLVSPYAYEWFIEAELWAAKGQHEEAALAFEKATAAPAHDVVLMSRLAEEYELSGAARRADRALTLARRYFPGSAQVALTEGRIQENRGQTEEALASFVRAGQLAPDSEEPVIAMARALETRGHSRRASAVLLEYARSADGLGAEAAVRELIDLAHRTDNAATLGQALSLDSNTTHSAGARRAGQLALDTGQPALAARILQGTLDTPKNVRLWLQALVQSGDRAEATRFLTSTVGERFANAQERAALLLTIGQAERALEVLRPARRSARGQYLEGRALLARGDYVEAATLLAGIPLGTATFEAGRLALADCSLSQRRPGAAAESLSIAPHGSLAVREKLAAIYLDEGELRAGLRLFDAKQAAGRGALASIFERAGRFEEAAAYFAAVQVHASSDPRLRARASAEQLAAHGREQGAIALLERWTSMAPYDLYSRVRLVELHQSVGDTEAVQKTAQQALPLIDEPLLRAHLLDLLAAPNAAPE